MANASALLTHRRPLGKSSVHVPALGFGSSGLGNLFKSIDDAAAQATVHYALERGFTYFDTAPHYGFGLSESRLGEAIANYAGDANVVLSSKVGRVLEPIAQADPKSPRHGFVDAAPFEPVFDYTYDGVMRSFESSCTRLRRDRLDVLFAHDLGAATHGADHARRFEEFFEGGYLAMRALRDAQVVSAIGLGVNEWQVCEQALTVGEFDCMLLAGRYTLLDQSALDRLFPLCERRGVSLIIGGPYNSGILVQGTRTPHLAYHDYAPARAEVLAQVARIEAVCDQYQVPLAAAALQFPLRHPVVASVIPGIGSGDQLDDTLRWASVYIPDAFWSALQRAGLMHPHVPTAERPDVDRRIL